MLRDTARVGTDEGKRRGPSEKRLVRGLVVGLLVVAGLVAYSLAQWLDERPEAVRYRNHGIDVIHAELGKEPPPVGSNNVGEDVFNAATRPLGVIAFYTQPPGGCASVQAYYSPRLTAAGWASESLVGNGAIRIAFSKEVEGYHLKLDVMCNPDSTYTVGIFNQ